jgi:signal transduction histidine kinase/CheY-like chemotaxis protein
VLGAARQSLLWKYTAHLGGLVSVLLVVSGALGGAFAYRESVSALQNLQQTRALFAAVQIDSFLKRQQKALLGIVTKLDTMDEVETEYLRIEVIALLRYHPEISDLRWIDSGGRLRFSMSRYGIEARPVERGASDLPHGMTSGIHVSPVYFRQQTEPYVTVAALAVDRGPVLEAEVNLRFVRDVIRQAQSPVNGLTYVVDHRGHLISHPDDSLVFARTDLTRLPQVQRALAVGGPPTDNARDARDLAGVAMVSSAAPVAATRWFVFSEQALDDAFQPVYASVARSVVLVLVGVASAVVASLLLARRMVRPIREIETRSRQLGEGQYEQRIDVRGNDELGALARQFNRMAARLQETHATQEARIAERTRELVSANASKTRFLAAASHDLRQPIHALSLFVGELNAVHLSPDAAMLAGRIERSVESLESLSSALLDLSKLDVGAIQPRPEDLALQTMLARLALLFEPTASAKGLSLSQVRTSAWVRSDPLLLERVLLNLITNALRYTRRGRVLLGCRRRGDQVEVVVADTGIGIAPEHLPKVFDEFYRAGPPPREDGQVGLGLGLAIVRRLAALLGHPVQIDSVPGRGTVVRLLLPRAVPHGPPATGPTPDARANAASDDLLQRRRILVIDDEAPARDALRSLLSRWGCEVYTAAGRQEAIAQARACRPEVVLCDLRLADNERGTEVIAALELQHGDTIRFAFVTGESAPELITDARATGHVLLFKPTRPAKLRAALEHLLRQGPDGTQAALTLPRVQPPPVLP